MNTNESIFDQYTFNDLFKEIKQRSDDKKDQLELLFTDIRKHITDKNDALMFLPRIKELMDVGVKNDEQLVKLASVCQKLIVLSSGGVADTLTDSDKELLMKDINALDSEFKDLKVPIFKNIK